MYNLNVSLWINLLSVISKKKISSGTFLCWSLSNWVSKVILWLLGPYINCYALWFAQKSCATFSTNQKQNQNQFAVMYLLGVLIGLLDCLHLLWSVRVISFVLVLWQSSVSKPLYKIIWCICMEQRPGICYFMEVKIRVCRPIWQQISCSIINSWYTIIFTRLQFTTLLNNTWLEDWKKKHTIYIWHLGCPSKHMYKVERYLSLDFFNTTVEPVLVTTLRNSKLAA